MWVDLVGGLVAWVAWLLGVWFGGGDVGFCYVRVDLVGCLARFGGEGGGWLW